MNQNGKRVGEMFLSLQDTPFSVWTYYFSVINIKTLKVICGKGHMVSGKHVPDTFGDCSCQPKSTGTYPSRPAAPPKGAAPPAALRRRSLQLSLFNKCNHFYSELQHQEVVKGKEIHQEPHFRAPRVNRCCQRFMSITGLGIGILQFYTDDAPGFKM